MAAEFNRESTDQFTGYSGTHFRLIPSKTESGDYLIKNALIASLDNSSQQKIINEASYTDEQIDGFRPVYEFENTGTEYRLRVKHIIGKTLEQAAASAKTAADKLKLCIAISGQLARVHAQQIIHLNLHPDHILIEEGTGTVYFISNGLSTRVQKKILLQSRGISTEADADYIAPEQTGRIGSEVSYSSDIYSLGICFYKLFTGKLPFGSMDHTAKIHAHIALLPPSPEELADVPRMISRIIMKMIDKSTDKRYHSADGVYRDLTTCLEALGTGKDIPLFETGLNDSSGNLRLVHKLYGRDKEIELLREAFHEISRGSREFILVYGQSGVGKSSLVEQLYKPVLQESGFFISGKFDPLKTDVPYFAFSQAFGKLIDQIMLMDEEDLDQWKSELNRVLHPIGRVLFDIVPGLGRLMPDEPELPVLNGLDAQLRFNYAIGVFLKLIAEFNKPLVLFLDDLQWTDNSSLELIKNLLTDAAHRSILLIGAYRDNEVTAGHIFLKFKMELEEDGFPFEEIQLNNLTLSDVNEYIQDTLGHSELPLDDLSRLVYKKSGGNALFLNQFVKSIYDREMLFFDRSSRSWKWDTQNILEFNVEGDIVDLLLKTINNLPAETISLLKTASCIGNKFNPDVLSKISREHHSVVYRHLKPAIDIGLIIESGVNTMYFVHDRVQQALYSLTDDEDKGSYHLSIGRIILENTPEASLRDAIFDIVNQLNVARDLITEEKEKRRLSELNFIAGNRSQNATAYGVALQYYEYAIQQHNQDDWKHHFRFSWDLFFQAAVAANQCNRIERYTELTAILDQRVSNTLDLLKLADLKIQRATSDNNSALVLDIGLTTLAKVRIHLKKKPGQLDVLLGYLMTNFRLRKYSTERIKALPKITNEELIISMAMMHHVSLAAYFIEPNLVPLIMFELIRLTLKHGLGPKSPFAFVVYGYINIAYMNKRELGLKMGQLGYELSSVVNHVDQVASLKQVYNTFISHWMMHLGKTVPDLEDGLKKGLETGDFAFSSINAQLIIYWIFYSGERIDRVLKRGELLSLQVAPLNQIMQIERIKMFRQSVMHLTTGVEDFHILKGDIYDETRVNFPQEPAFDLYYHNLNMQKKFLAMVFNEHETAWEFCCREKAFMVPVKGSPTEQLFYFYESLCITTIWSRRTETERKKLLGILKKNLAHFKDLAAFSTINYQHRYELMHAEYLQLTGQNDQAMRTYSDAIRMARLNKFIHDEALIWERTGMFYLTLKQDEVAQFYLSNAFKAYKKWGATAKMAYMLEEYKGYISSEEIGSGSSSLDLNTILKTINLLSGEVVLETLLTGLMNLVAENAGAERAFLILQEKDRKVVKASVDKAQNSIQVLQDIPYEDFESISHSVLNYVARSGETLVLDNAAEKLPFANDDYIMHNEVRSIVCHPLKHAGTGFAYLYLENNLVAGAFTKERVEILQVIATQTAISLQNAMLFEQTNRLNTELTQEVEVRKAVEENLRINERRLEEYNLNLENKVNERTRDLQAEKEKTDELLLNILPYDIAMELKEKGKAEAKTFESVSVLFTDFKGFTNIAETMSANDLVSEIDYCFKEFDRIIQKYPIEKIKTIGDSYMAVGGLPVANTTHPVDVVSAALEIRDFINRHNEERKISGKPVFEIRLGIHTGTVVAGIVGLKKFAYDIWGDTVNLASRMESSGEPGKVNISGSTFDMVKDNFQCTHRGKIQAKNKGQVDMYFAERM